MFFSRCRQFGVSAAPRVAFSYKANSRLVFTRRASNGGNEKNQKNDRELLADFNKPLAQLMAGFHAAASPEGSAKIMQLHKQNPQISSIFALAALFNDMQNPLLIKYKFDLGDFVLGAREAFRQMQLAVASKDFFEYASNVTTSSTDNDFLSEVLNPNLHAAVVRAAAAEVDRTEGRISDMVVETAEVRECFVTHVETFMGNEIKEMDEAKNEWEAVKQAVGVNPTDIPDEANESLERFPDDAVVADVHVYFNVLEAFKKPLVSNAGVSVNAERVTKTICTFRGCISGHTDLEWRVVDFRL